MWKQTFRGLLLSALVIVAAGCSSYTDFQMKMAGTVRYANNTERSCRIFLDGGEKSILDPGEEYTVTNVIEGEHEVSAFIMGGPGPHEHKAMITVFVGMETRWDIP